jgi:flagellar hook protein FlgE
MGLTTAMYTGLSGMNVNQTRIETIGNNIANVNTPAFKSSRTLFQSQVSQLISAGTAPSAQSGGVNPTQVGLGAAVGSTQRLFTPGSIESTGVKGDLAVEGDGFFVLRRANGQQVYSRDGSFALDAQNRLVSTDGHAVRGFGVDSNFSIVPNVLTDLVVPLGTTTVARATGTARMDGNLSADGAIATQGSRHATQAMVDGGGAAAAAATALVDLRSASSPAVPLFGDGNTITVRGISKGEREVPTQTFVVGQTGSTLGDFASWLQSTLGIHTGAGIPGTPGVTIQDGALVVDSNAGRDNGLSISGNDITTDNDGVPVPFAFTQSQQANGSSVYTAFTVYDSLGTPVIVNGTFTLEQTAATGPVWRFYVNAPEQGGAPVGTGTISFDNQGNFVSAAGNQLALSRDGTGAASPLQLTLDFSSLHGLSTAESNVVMSQQDGFPPGTLTDFSIAADGTVSGIFSNGLTRTLGQVALAVFSNRAGLVADGDNVYLEGPNSGTALVTAPGLSGAGTILSGALELSNVDLAREFIGLITSSTGFQASSRVISTSSDLLDQLLLIVR